MPFNPGVHYDARPLYEGLSGVADTISRAREQAAQRDFLAQQQASQQAYGYGIHQDQMAYQYQALQQQDAERQDRNALTQEGIDAKAADEQAAQDWTPPPAMRIAGSSYGLQQVSHKGGYTTIPMLPEESNGGVATPITDENGMILGYRDENGKRIPGARPVQPLSSTELRIASLSTPEQKQARITTIQGLIQKTPAAATMPQLAPGGNPMDLPGESMGDALKRLKRELQFGGGPASPRSQPAAADAGDQGALTSSQSGGDKASALASGDYVPGGYNPPGARAPGSPTAGFTAPPVPVLRARAVGRSPVPADLPTGPGGFDPGSAAILPPEGFMGTPKPAYGGFTAPPVRRALPVQAPAPSAMAGNPPLPDELPNLNAVAPRPLDRATAQQFIQQAGGDKARARQLALAAGYQF